MIEDCEYLDEGSESNDDESIDSNTEQISQSTLEAAAAAKVSIEKYYKNLFRSLHEREQR
jgi:hypothetical protein